MFASWRLQRCTCEACGIFGKEYLCKKNEKHLLFFIISFCAFSCQQTSKNDYSNLIVDNIQYSAYRWRTNSNTLEQEFFLAYYININKDGSYKGMNHNIPNEPAIYFKGTLDRYDWVCQLLDSLSIVVLDTLYISPELRIYDGNTFALDFNKEQTRHKIDFLQLDAPTFLKSLSYKLDLLALYSKNEIMPFNLSIYEEELKKRSLKITGELPKVQPAPNSNKHIKFRFPTTKKPRN